MLEKSKVFMLFCLVFFSVGLSVVSQPTLQPTVPLTNPVYFSFASDDEHDGPTFISNLPNTFWSAAIVDFMVDTNADMPGGVHIFNARNDAFYSISGYTVTQLGPNLYLHTWFVSGFIMFAQINPVDIILVIPFSNALLTSYSDSSMYVGDTMTFEVSERTDSSLQFLGSSYLDRIGVTQQRLSESEDASLTFTHVYPDDGRYIPVVNGLFGTGWTAEGSFSASVGDEPIPTAAP